MIKSKKQKAKETIEIIEKGYRTERKIHPGYIEWLTAKKKLAGKRILFRQYFGKYHYTFIKGDMRISMIKILDNPFSQRWVWEIHAYEDKRLFRDVQKFRTKKDAMKAVDKYLRG